MQFVTEWIRNIIVFALSDNASSYSSKFEFAKYVKFVVSLLLVVLILTPLLNYCRQM